MRRLLSKLHPLFWSLGFLAVSALIYGPSWLHEGSGLRFENPWFLLGLLAVPLVIAAGMLERRSSGRVRFPLVRVLAQVGSGWRVRLVPVSTGLRACGIAF